MAKKRGGDRIETNAPRALTQSPFAALAGAALPPRDEGPKTEEPAPPAPPVESPALRGKIVVRREVKGRGGKTVTRITGLPEPSREELAARLKRALGCGAVLEGDDVLVLGDLVDRAASFLEAEGARRVVRAR